MNHKVKKAFKIFGIVIFSLLILVTALILSLRLPFVQNEVKNYLVDYLEDKIETKVALDRVYIDFPSSIVMENLYLQGQKTDTLLFAKKFDVGLNIPKLLKNTVDLTSIDLDGIHANVVRNPDGTFNFDYIIDAFVTKDQEATESEPWVISLDKIKLHDIHVNFNDLQRKNDLKVYFTHFETSVEEFDLEQNSYALDAIVMDGLNLSMDQDLLEEVAQETEEKVDSLNAQAPMKIDLNRLELTNFNVHYADAITQTYGDVIFEELSSDIDEINLEKQIYRIDNIVLSNADLKFDLFLPAEDHNTSAENPSSNTNPILVLNDLDFENVKLQYDNSALGNQAGLDYNHLNFEKINLSAEDFEMKDGEISGKIASAQIIEPQHLNIRELRTNFLYGANQTYLKNLYLETDRSLLRDELILSYQNQDQLSIDPGSVNIQADINQSRISLRDILDFMPSLATTAPFDKYPNAIINLDTDLFGTLNDIRIRHLNADGLGDIKLAVTGNVKNAMNPDYLAYDLNIGNLSGSSKTLQNILPLNTIPNNIRVPDKFWLNGTAKGNTEIVDANLHVNSTDGNADVLAQLDLRNKGIEKYDINTHLTDLNIGKILKNKDLGKISGKIYANGVGFEPQTANLNFTGDINYIDYNRYRYRKMNLEGDLKNGYYNVLLDSKDPSANLTLRANGYFDEAQPTIQMAGNIRQLNLQKLNFYDEPLILAGNINGDFTNLNPDELNGEFTLSNFAISDTQDVFPMQEVHFVAANNASVNSLTLNSQVADVYLTGDYQLTKIFDAMMQTINKYYQFQPKSNTAIVAGQYMDFDIKIKDDDLIRKFLPDLEAFETITLTGNYNTDTESLNIEGNIPSLSYGEYNLESGKLLVNTENNAIQYNLNFAGLNSEQFQLNQLAAVGNIAQNTIDYNISTQDVEGEEQYLIAGNIKSQNDQHIIQLDPNGFKLNYDNWEVNPDNQLRFNNSGGIHADNFILRNGNSVIEIQSENQNLNSPLNINLKDFEIATITEIIKKDELPASGTINGDIALRDIQSNMNFTTDLQIADLSAYEQLIGDLNLQVNSKNADLLDVNVLLSDNGNDAKITGDYRISTQALNLTLDLNRLNFESLEGLAQNEIQETEGYFTGKLDINGTTDAPKIVGKIELNDIGLKITQTGSDFRNINDELIMNQEGILFNSFTLTDNSGNELVVNGKVLTQDYTNFAFNLDVKSDDFKVVDSEENNDQMIFGVLAIDADLQIGGDLDLPKVDGSLAVTDVTDFTFVVPQDTPSLEAREGIVKFVDKDQVALQGTLVNDSIPSETRIKGMDVNVGISVTKEANISLIIDKATGDFVKLSGDAELTGGIDPSGKTTLVGVYQVEEGAYELNVSLMKRKFDIQKGSTITWNGEPLEATLDITAIYKTNAAPIDLVQQQLSGLSPAEYNMYKQRIPFKTVLKMEGDIMKPVITFDITLEDDNPSIATSVIDNTKTKLQQIRQDESELNKQVFALLLMNRFIGENPFATESGMSAGTMARQSVSQILSQQLNKIASDLIAGVDLEFDFNSYDDYSQGEKNTRTDLDVGLSKRLLNDRIKITVGSKFGLEGTARENEEMTNIAGDVNIDYMLSKNGRYVLRAFRTNQYEVALQGQIIETGLGFIITLEFDEFKDIFQKNQQKD